MIIQPRHFVRFIDGRAGTKLNIAFLPGMLGAYINTLQTDVAVELEYARKLVRHRIRCEEFAHIQETIDNGMCFLDVPRHLKFLYVRDNVRPVIYFLLLKAVLSRNELWLVTFHRIQRKQFTDRIDPPRLVREHAEREFMG